MDTDLTRKAGLTTGHQSAPDGARHPLGGQTMNLDHYTNISWYAYPSKVRGVQGAIYAHASIIEEFGTNHLRDHLLMLVYTVLDVENPGKTGGGNREFTVRIALKDVDGKSAEVDLKLTERQVSPAAGDRIVLIDWDGHVVRYLNQEIP